MEGSLSAGDSAVAIGTARGTDVHLSAKDVRRRATTGPGSRRCD